jgi:retron-type reverse transcriptase
MKGDLPTKILLATNDILTPKLTKIFNDTKNREKFPSCLKMADVTPLPKDREKDNKKKYRPVSLTPIMSKVFEKEMYGQIYAFAEEFLSPYVFGYRSGHNSEQCLLVMIEMWKKALDEHQVAGAVLTDLSKAFDCIPHNLLIAKLHAYGFGKSALRFIKDYLTGRTQRTKVSGEYSTKRAVKYGVPQGSVLGPLLFNLFMNDIFYFLDKSKLANYADDASTYVCEKGIFPLLHLLKSETETVLNWFKINEMKSNSDKCHLIVAENEHRPAYISNCCIYLDQQMELLQSETIVKMLGVWIDNQMKFGQHVKTLLGKGNQKLHALMRVAKYTDEEKLRILMKTFIESQFKYCPLLWMFHSKALDDRINKLHERALRVVYKDDSNLTFEQLLEKDKSFSTHHRNLQHLAILMYQVKNNLAPAPVQEIFRLNTSERANGNWVIPKVRTVNNGIETVRYRGPLIWNLLPEEIKSAKSLQSFKEKIKLWKPHGCTCRICLSYIHGVGYIERPF